LNGLLTERAFVVMKVQYKCPAGNEYDYSSFIQTKETLSLSEKSVFGDSPN